MNRVLSLVLFFSLFHPKHASAFIIKSSDKINSFCKKITSNLVEGSISQDKIKNGIIANFGNDLGNNQKKVQEIFDGLSTISSPENDPEQFQELCVQRMTPFFRTVAGNLFNFAKVEQDAALTREAYSAGLSMVGGTAFLPFVYDTEAQAQAKPEVKSLCKLNELENCEVSTTPLTEIESVAVFSGANTKPFSVEDCECYDKKSTESKQSIIAKAQKESDEIDHLIIKEAGKNFVNDYASFYEDIRFYETNKAWALKEDGEGKKDKIESNVLCVDPKIFQKAVDESCEKSGMSQGKEARTTELLSVFGNHFDGSQKGFEGSFKALINDIESNPVKPKKINGAENKDGHSVNISRESYDKVRLGYAKGMPEVSVVNELVAIVIKDKELKAKLDAKMIKTYPPLSPLEAFQSLFSMNGLDERDFKKVLRKVSENKKNNSLIKRLSAGMENSTVDAYGKNTFDMMTENIFKVALSYHPGLKNVLMDPVLFDKVAQDIDGDDKGIIRKAERNKNLLGSFNDRCIRLIDELAEAVCTNPSQLKAKVNTQDMVKLMAEQNLLKPKNSEAQEGINLLLCSMNKNQHLHHSAFQGPREDAPFAVSDYRNRKDITDQAKQENPFSKFATNLVNDPSFRDTQQKVADDVNYASMSSGQINSNNGFHSSGSSDNLFDMGDLDFRPNKPNVSSLANAVPLPSASKMNNSVEKNSASSSSSTIEQISDQFASPVSQGNVPSALPMMIPKSVAKAPEPKDSVIKDEEVSPVKEELKNSFPKSDQKKVESLVSNLNDEDAKELLRLREQSKKDKAEISDIKLQQEKNKTLELQAKYEALEKKLDSLTKPKNTSDTETSSFSSRDSSKDIRGQGMSQISEKSNVSDFQATSGASSGSPSQTSAPQTSGGTLNRASAGSNAVSNQANELKPQVGLIINSQIPKGQNKAEDPSQELIAFLAKNEPDFKTLYELKDSGLIFNYVVQENGVPVPKSKVIKYSELSETAKKLVDQKILKLDTKEAAQLKEQIIISRRAYSIQALKLELLSSDRSLNK